MLKLYGKKQSRAGRCVWVLEELGLEYTLIPLDPGAGETRTPEFRVINPQGKVPALVEDDFVLTESIAITYYLASRAPSALWPTDPKQIARVYEWSSWASTEIEYHFTMMIREMRNPTPNADTLAACKAGIAGLFGHMEQHLAKGSAYLVGDQFTVADINTAFLAAGLSKQFDMTQYPHVAAWLERCTSRPAWQRAMA